MAGSARRPAEAGDVIAEHVDVAHEAAHGFDPGLELEPVPRVGVLVLHGLVQAIEGARHDGVAVAAVGTEVGHARLVELDEHEPHATHERFGISAMLH